MARKAKPSGSQPPVSNLPAADKVPAVLGSAEGPVADPTNSILIRVLGDYLNEARTNRQTGVNPRDLKWQEQLELYWNRYDFSKKAPWQSQAIMPEVPQLVDRFAAAMTDALSEGATGSYFEVEDPADVEGDIAEKIEDMMNVWLSEVGRGPTGQPLSFLAIFPELVKLGALMNVAATVVWRQTDSGGYVAVEPIDPRTVWLDHTGRGRYRIRRLEIDKTRLMELARMADKKGVPIYNLDAIEQLTASMAQELEEYKRRLTGGGTTETAPPKTITLDEYYGEFVGFDGKVIATNAMAIIANEKFLIRGPETNPNWHNLDWVVYSPLVTVPLSVYGRGYMENFGSLARLFTDLTNLIMDSTWMQAMNVFVGDTSRLEDPAQLAGGIAPNMFLRLAEGEMAKDMISTVQLGQTSPEALKLWLQVKDELREAGNFNELTAGNLAPNSRTTSTEIMSANQNGSIPLRDAARNLEQRVIEPILDLVWKTGLQHMKPRDPRMEAAVGPEMYSAIYSRRKELIQRPVSFKCRGITRMLAKQQKLRSLLSLLGVIAQNQVLLQKFLQKVDPDKLLDMMFSLQDIDLDKLELSPREKMMQAITQGAAGPGMPDQGPGTGQPLQPQSAAGPEAMPMQGMDMGGTSAPGP